jgi:hypothetical protein
VSTVHHGDGYTRTVLLTGRVEANRESDIGFEWHGTLSHAEVDEDDSVSRSRVLASLPAIDASMRASAFGLSQLTGDARNLLPL